MRAICVISLVVMLAKVATEQACNCNCGCEPQVIIQDGCPCVEDRIDDREATDRSIVGGAGPGVPIKYPVILVPGDAGSQIQAKLDGTNQPHLICKTDTSDFFNVWLSIHLLLPYLIDCLVHNMELHYNATTRTTRNAFGVTTRVPGWGNTDRIDWLDTVHIPKTCYYNDVSDALVRVGYTRGSSLRGAPYDFRKAPNEMQDFFIRYQALIEETYNINNGKQVVLIGHSMGNVVTLYFFNNIVSQTWKDKYIRVFVTLAAPWGGAMKTLKMFTTGLNFGIPGVSALTLRPVLRSMPSSAWLLPSPKFWDPSEPLVRAPNRTYTTSDYEDFFDDIDFSTGYEMRKDTQNLIIDLNPPAVAVYCLYGTKVDTFGTFDYTDATWPNGEPTYVHDGGDGTVNIRSLEGCLMWKGNQSQPVVNQEYPGVSHTEILHDTDVIQYIISSVLFK